MIDFDFRPTSYFDGTGPSSLLVKLTYPESQWGEEINIYCNVLDGEFLFEAIDYYGNEIDLNPEKSNQPLSLQEIIFLIESMEVKNNNLLGNIELTLSGIPEAESQFYPDLSRYFQDKRKTFGLD
ncbi:UDP-glucuronosyltransferase [Cecembia sp.]|uniref:UDP-glucuronosyltransferase n=1 Tax=Cecembia sp. TaxID=1898110 RepID=UPI0025C495D9|nr:UDP-glucuronosyltransferase [Cecembia sp.]